jgi:hypothetical protein
MALVTFPERKVTRAVGRRGKDMDVEQQRHWVPAFAGMTVQTKTGTLRRPFCFMRFKLAAHRAAA